MSLKANLVAVAAVATIGGVAFMGANTVSAQTSGESLVEKLSERFDLDQTEVEAFFTEQKEIRQAEREEKRAEHLQSLVDEGVITEDQRALLEEKKAELKAEFEDVNFRELSDEEREALREQRQANKAEFEQWAEDNGINLDDIRPERGEGRGFGPRGGFRG